ncbi:MAG: S1 RNA-binding domain-containing protein [Candidatus Moduliflexus flocculans]|nr:S1 RNA-binding domain-containing protein [Candidatus Moduliflexus flocculans]
MEGKVERAVKGGYEVRIGGQRAFCPFSQIDTVRTRRPAAHEGQRLRVPHHRVQGRRQEPRRLAAGAARRGAAGRAPPRSGESIVRRRRADRSRGLGARATAPSSTSAAGVQGLLHVSEMGVVARVRTPSQVVAPGQEITVKVLRVDEDATEDRPRAEAAHRRSVVDGPGVVRGGPGARRAASRASRSSARSSSWSPGSRRWRTPPPSRRRGGPDGWSSVGRPRA